MFTALRLMLPGSSTLIIYGVVALAVSGVFTGWSIHEYNKGWNAAISSIAVKDKEATDAVKKAITSVEKCDADGGRWNTTDGVCVKP